MEKGSGAVGGFTLAAAPAAQLGQALGVLGDFKKKLAGAAGAGPAETEVFGGQGQNAAADSSDLVGVQGVNNAAIVRRYRESGGVYAALKSTDPVIRIRIRLQNGQSVDAPFNPDMTIRDVRSFLDANHNYADAPYQLYEGFPPKPIEEVGSSLRSLGLADGRGSLIQRLR
mmetsp:Transcript_85770/g.195529  ORF Transcript_85770/g.195529 Transcript_85770/m.195529 type:complete len:171 (+) Transcript_85770:1-513(+)